MSEVAARPARISAWGQLGLYIVVFAAIYAVVHAAQSAARPHFDLSTPRAMAAFRGAFAIALDWLEVIAMIVLLRLMGRGLSDIGWARRAPVRGWVAAIVAAALYLGFAFSGPILRGAPILTDWSVFRIAMALGIAITAGFCEEAIFRGFVMSRARDGGAPVWLQILLSAVLFGLAHGGWGSMGGKFEVGAMIGAMIATTILGVLLAGAYVLSRRSLVPVVAAHALIDMVIEPWLILFALTGGFVHAQ